MQEKFRAWEAGLSMTEPLTSGCLFLMAYCLGTWVDNTEWQMPEWGPAGEDLGAEEGFEISTGSF